MDQGRVHAVAQILRRIDQRAIQIENQQFQPFNGKRTKFVNHVFSVMGKPLRSSRRERALTPAGAFPY
jgi:hypothetical protein